MQSSRLVLTISVVFLVACLSYLVSCQQKMQKASDVSKVDEVAKEIFGEKYQIEKNISADFALIVQQSKVRPTEVFPRLDFCVYDIERDSIIFRHSINHGNVGWQNDHQIFFENVPTRAESKRSPQYFDVKREKSTSIDSK